MNFWLSKIALRERTAPKVGFWFAIKLSRNQFHLLWIIQCLMEWEMAKRGAWAMRWSKGCVCDMGGYATQNESRGLRCAAERELLSFHRCYWCGMSMSCLRQWFVGSNQSTGKYEGLLSWATVVTKPGIYTLSNKSNKQRLHYKMPQKSLHW